jgi:hypothetical protein
MSLLASSPEADDPEEARTMRRIDRAMQIATGGGLSSTYTDENQSRVLGLPAQTGGWGLLIFQNREQAVIAACERALVAALDERGGDLPGWNGRIKLWADWDDRSIATGQPLAWEARD